MIYLCRSVLNVSDCFLVMFVLIKGCQQDIHTPSYQGWCLLWPPDSSSNCLSYHFRIYASSVIIMIFRSNSFTFTSANLSTVLNLHRFYRLNNPCFSKQYLPVATLPFFCLNHADKTEAKPKFSYSFIARLSLSINIHLFNCWVHFSPLHTKRDG